MAGNIEAFRLAGQRELRGRAPAIAHSITEWDAVVRFTGRRRDAMGRLDGRVAIVTGAAEGIGVEYAKALAGEGARVALCDLNPPDAVVNAIRAAGGTAIGMVCDVADPAAARAMAAETDKAFGRIDILVNNAAVFARMVQKPMDQLTSEEWDLALKVNVRGPFECAKAVLPAMRRNRYGKIVNITSGTVFKGTPMMLHYLASKGAVLAMTRGMARELGGDGIGVNAIAPGLTMTEGIRARSDSAGAAIAATEASRALRREQIPRDLIGTLLFLASPDSDFMTGQTVVVDGGSAMW
jgi:NAD(P)-dependent dehydrogenase (short-subunit alcohol dehydrogenase family)